MRIALFIFLFLSATLKIFSQAYQAEYSCYLFNTPNKLQKDSVIKNNLKRLIPMTVSLVYKLKCNSRYIDVAGYLSGSNLPNSTINFSASNSRIVIDLKKKLVFYPNEKKVDSLIEYEYDNPITEDSCFTYNLPAVKSFNNITGCKKNI